MVASFLFVLVSCTTPLRDSYSPPRTSLPTGGTEPHSWDNLAQIESWLASSDARSRPEAVPAAELELAQGRVDLARRDRGKVSEHVLDLRLDLAEAGFQRVLAHGSSSSLDKSMARDGISSIHVLRVAAPVVATSSGALPTIRSRASWGARPAVPSRLRPNQRPWTKITVHHSATPSASFGGGSTAGAAGAIQSIQKAHMNSEGWGDIGYHFLIDPAGRLYQGRSLSWQGAHAGGTNNVANIGICLLGNFDVERPDPRALATLESLIGALSKRHGVGRSAVKGHQAYKATACPGKRLEAWVEDYARGRT